MGFFNNPVKDAKKIQKEVPYEVLRASWDSFVRIKKTGFQKAHGMATPAWFALFAIQNHKGKWDKFDADELHLIGSFKTVHNAYDDIINALSEHDSDEHLGEYILSNHPNLMEVAPKEYRNADNINEYITKTIRRYQEMLKEYYERYQEDIDATITRLENEPTPANEGELLEEIKEGDER